MSFRVPVYFSPDYVLARHEFDTTRKASWVYESLATVPIAGIEVRAPEPLTAAELGEVHDPEYVEAVRCGELRELAESQGFAWDPALWTMVRASNGGAVAAARAALVEGTAGSLSSGLHHARRRHGAGSCTFNGLAPAARAGLQAGAGGGAGARPRRALRRRDALAPGRRSAGVARRRLCERPRVAEGSVDVRLADLTDAEALLLLRIWLAAQRRRLREAQRSPEEPEDILNYVAAPSGGLALWDDEGLCRIAPACCCSLDNRQDWRDAMAQRGADSETLWTGHPWSEVRYEAPFLVLQPPAGPRLSVHPRHLARLLAAAEATIEAFAERLRPLLRDLPEAAVEAWVRRCAGR